MLLQFCGPIRRRHFEPISDLLLQFSYFFFVQVRGSFAQSFGGARKFVLGSDSVPEISLLLSVVRAAFQMQARQFLCSHREHPGSRPCDTDPGLRASSLSPAQPSFRHAAQDDVGESHTRTSCTILLLARSPAVRLCPWRRAGTAYIALNLRKSIAYGPDWRLHGYSATAAGRSCGISSPFS